ncbi:MAG: SUMF1/EgtB/PvdO family nonheme iron enzyme, partial [Candidatus Promineifilaceae bacterium]
LWPVRVILREYAARGLSKELSLWEYIEDDLGLESVKLAGYAPDLKERLQEEGGILLLDGLDEVDKAAKVREGLKNNIELFARDFSKVRVVVTSRPYAYGSGWELDGFNVTRLLPFSEEQINFFVEQWYTVMGQVDPTLGPEKAGNYSGSLIRQIEQISNLREMAQHPLLLTMMVYIHRGREGGALPQRREELYRLCVVLLLDLWRRSKTVSGKETRTLTEELGMDTEQLLKALAELAFIAHHDQPDQEQTADIPGVLLAGTLHKYTSKESKADLYDIIDYVRDRAGLLEDHGRNADDSDDVYRFPHRTFQEYLAAKHLHDAPDFPDELVKLARNDPTRWREAVSLAGAMAAPKMRWLLVEGLYGTKSVLKDMIDPSDYWGAFLAGQVLVENEMYNNPSDSHQDKVARVQGWHRAILSRERLPPLDRAAAGRVLALLGDNRPGVGIIKKDGILIPNIEWGIEISAGTYEIGGDKDAYASFKKQLVPIERPYCLARYPITNIQFQSFINAPDWDNAQWWQDIPPGEKEFNKPFFPFDNHPRESVSWYQAVAFCRWLSDKLDYVVDLPHEYEWESAARYPDGRFYPWGNDFEAEKANTSEGGIGQTTAVGMYPSGRNPDLDLYDLSGDVWEWCRNKYNEPAEAWLDKDPVDSSNDERVLRGGAWLDLRDSSRAAARYSSHPDFRYGLAGFRVVVRRPPSQDH